MAMATASTSEGPSREEGARHDRGDDDAGRQRAQLHHHLERRADPPRPAVHRLEDGDLAAHEALVGRRGSSTRASTASATIGATGRGRRQLLSGWLLRAGVDGPVGDDAVERQRGEARLGGQVLEPAVHPEPEPVGPLDERLVDGVLVRGDGGGTEVDGVGQEPVDLVGREGVAQQRDLGASSPASSA